MLGQEYTKSNGELLTNGQSILIRCADGRFIIVDGGHGTAAVANELLQTMKEQSADYAKTAKDITVAAWIVTHAHGDHFGALVNQYNVFRGITVERILVNFLSETERLKAIGSSEVGKNWSATEGGAYTKVPAAAAALGAEIHNIHTGQVYYVADVEMEVLYTIESFAPKVCNALNTSSTVMRMNLAGTTYMSTGDATGNGMEICNKMYGDYLQSDIVQVCHHGGSTWGNDAGMVKAYQTINAPTVLWPRGFATYESAKTATRNVVLYKVPNYKEDYVSGVVGDLVILPMPYTVGTATEIRAQ
jgi:beta-lactamase superfamily II metal-dependent hydrolase